MDYHPERRAIQSVWWAHPSPDAASSAVSVPPCGECAGVPPPCGEGGRHTHPRGRRPHRTRCTQGEVGVRGGGKERDGCGKGRWRGKERWGEKEGDGCGKERWEVKGRDEREGEGEGWKRERSLWRDGEDEERGREKCRYEKRVSEGRWERWGGSEIWKGRGKTDMGTIRSLWVTVSRCVFWWSEWEHEREGEHKLTKLRWEHCINE